MALSANPTLRVELRHVMSQLELQYVVAAYSAKSLTRRDLLSAAHTYR